MRPETAAMKASLEEARRQAASEERQREALGIDPEQLIRELSERMADAYAGRGSTRR